MIEIVEESGKFYIRDGEKWMLKDSTVEREEFPSLASAEGYLRAVGVKIISHSFTVEPL